MRAGMVVAVICLGVARPAPIAAASLATADLPWLDPEEAASLLADLEEAGLLPADLDLAGLAVPVRAKVDDQTRPSWSCRLETADDGRVRSSLDGRLGPVELQLRARRGEDDAPQVGGCVWVEDPHWAVAAGGVGVQHGLGLVAAGPGRNRSASSSGSLLPGETGPRHWSSPDGASGVRGLVVQWRAGAVVAGGMVGRREQSPGGGFTAERAAWLAVRRPGLAVSVLSCPGRGDGARSLAVEVSRGGLDLRAETAAWRDAPSTARAASTGASFRWRGRKGAVEALAATSAAAAGARFASRPACLIGWDGRGWAVRGRLALGPALTGTVLAAAAEDRPARTIARDRVRRQTLDVGVRGRRASSGTWALRWRRREELHWSHDEAAPWRPPRRDGHQATDTFVAEGELRAGAGDLGGALRYVAQGGDDERGGRAVVSLVWRGPVGPLRATLGGSWAWGDPVAVSTVTTPVAGLAVPRSWSHWSDEIHVGVDLAAGPWRCQAAVARRAAALDAPGPAAWQGWLRLAVAW